MNILLIAALAIGGALAPLAAQTAQSKPGDVAQVTPTVLETLLPAPAGWIKGAATTEKAMVSETCSYTFAYAAYMNNGMRVRLTIADTAFDEGALAALATMVMIFPDNHVGLIPPATAIKRSLHGTWPAAELWDATTGEGEFTVVVDKRFVVKAEGTRLADVATARRFVEMINLETLRALK